LCNL
jgi:hypothetical protein